MEINRKTIKNKGITLIALVVTIVVLLILAGAAIGIILDSGLISRGDEAKFKNKMSAISEDYTMYTYNLMMNDTKTDLSKIHAGKILKEINRTDELELEEDKIQDIRKMLKEVGSKEEEYLMVYQGELYYVSQPEIKNNQKQVKWCEDLGIRIYEYIQSTGIQQTNGNYELINNSYYMCTPQLNTGWSREKTRYLVEKNGNLVPGDWVNKKPSNNWYDYEKQKWANIYVENNGVEAYYVWIPRYVYKKDANNQTAGNQRMDVKFVNLQNEYIDGKTGEKTDWETLQSQGYQIPEAFYWGDDATYTNNTPIPGYWMSKYQLSNLVAYPINFNTAATTSSITIQNIKVNTEKTIAKYTYALNGKIVHESKNGEDYKITGLAKGNKVINVTMLDENGEIIGSMTKTFEVANVNPPETSAFDQDTTFYVWWDENGIEHNEIPMSKPAPDEWYDYSIASWANIVTRNNGLECYYVWIPRYQYQLDSTSKPEKSYVRFIEGTSTDTESGYKIPEAFWWDKNDDGLQTDDEQLKGYWMSKYQLSFEESTARIDAEMSAGSSVIRIKDITGTLVTDGLKYEYYKNGEKVHEGTNAKENYSFTGLEVNQTYTINIIARNSSTNEYVGAITKKIKTIEANKPELSAFNVSEKDSSGNKLPMTYYVLYDDAGNETIGEKIKTDGSNMPKDWYDYSKRKWANIVITDGDIVNGKITNATNTTYLVWIPRYEYRILDRGKLDTSNRRIEVNFLSGTTNEVTPGGFQIPEAFYWGDDATYANNTPITGYWMSKYQLNK